MWLCEQMGIAPEELGWKGNNMQTDNVIQMPGTKTEPVVYTGPYIVSSADFLAGFVPPDYLIDGILQKRFIYSMTAPTGTGKTAMALMFAAHVARGKSIGDIPVEKGRVLYLAGENPDDIRMRWLASAEKTGFDRALSTSTFCPACSRYQKSIRPFLPR